MDLKQLKTFITLADNMNYTKTAAQLGYAQSSISAQIQQLEQELNTQLFDRIGKKIYLTSAGERLLPYANEMLFLSNKIKEELDINRNTQGTITIGASESLCIFLLPEIIKSFREHYPNIELQIKLTDVADSQQLLLANEIDLALIIGKPFRDSTFHSFLSERETICLLCSPGHPLQNIPLLEHSHLNNQTFILTSSSCNYRQAFEHSLRAHQINFHVALETGSVQSIKEMTLSGLGLGLLPKLAVHKELTNHLLYELPFYENYEIYTQLYCHGDKWISPPMEEFIQLVQSTYYRLLK